MLILSRRVGEGLVIGGKTSVTVLGVKGNQVRLGIDAPQDVSVHREEIQERVNAEQRQPGLAQLVLITPDGIVGAKTPSESEMENGEPTFAAIKAYAGMSADTTLEMVRCTYQGRPAWMLIDEDGLGKGLSINIVASVATRGHQIVGTAVIYTGELA